MNKVAKNIIALLTSILPIAPSSAEDQHLTIIGSWQIEDVRTFSALNRLSGKEGQIEYFLSPISDDSKKNGLFFVACVGHKEYIDIELQQKGVNINSVQPREFFVEIINADQVLTLLLDGAIIEHDFLKIPIRDVDVRAIGEDSQFDLLIRYRQAVRKTEYKMIKSQEAITYFLQRCNSSM